MSFRSKHFFGKCAANYKGHFLKNNAKLKLAKKIVIQSCVFVNKKDKKIRKILTSQNLKSLFTYFIDLNQLRLTQIGSAQVISDQL